MATPKPNYSLWEMKDSDFPKGSVLSDQLKYLCGYGHLAASSHNTQPWKFVIKDNTIQIHTDLTHRLHVADPTNKELYISVGCTIPNIEIAALHFGFKPHTKLFPNQKDEGHIATITLQNDSTSSNTSLFKYITKRLTNRSTYKKGVVLPQSLKNEYQDAVKLYHIDLVLYEGNIVKKLAEITKESMYVALSNPAFRDELSHWVRHNWTNQGDGLPGNTLGLPDAASVVIATLVRSPNMANESSLSEEKMINSSSAVGILYASTESKENWVRAGMTFSQLALISTQHKVSIAPLSGAIEMKQQRLQLLELVKENRAPLMFFRIGYATKKYPHSPRRPLNEVVTII